THSHSHTHTEPLSSFYPTGLTHILRTDSTHTNTHTHTHSTTSRLHSHTTSMSPLYTSSSSIKHNISSLSLPHCLLSGQADRQTGRQADRQTGRQADRQAGRQKGHTGRQVSR